MSINGSPDGTLASGSIRTIYPLTRLLDLVKNGVDNVCLAVLNTNGSNVWHVYTISK